MTTMCTSWRPGLAILLGLAFWTGTARAGTATVNGVEWSYSVSNGKASIQSGEQDGTPAIPVSTTGTIAIPPRLGDCPVTEIGSYAFHYCTNLTGVAIPDCVTNIGYAAFLGCSGLLEMEIPVGVARIGDFAFCVCSGLSSVAIPDSVTRIGTEAFKYCSNLPDLAIPDSVTDIGGYAFVGCTGLTNLVFPARVTDIRMGMCSECDNLRDVVLPAGVTNIGDYAFYTCSSLENLAIPDGVKEIGDYAFTACRELAGMDIPGSVRRIGDYSFLACNGMTDLVLREGTESIGEYAFYECDVTDIVIPASVTNIGFAAFGNDSGLTNVLIGSGTATIGDCAFCNAGKLEAFAVDSGNAHYKSEAGVLYTRDGRTLVAHPAGKNGTYDIPDGVTRIAGGAFYGCGGLTAVTIPESVESVGDLAFMFCTGLARLYVPASWEGTDMLADARLPSMLVVVYGKEPEGEATPPGPVAFEPAPGVLPAAGGTLEVALSAEPGLAIYYTLDGSRPVCTNAAGGVLWSATAREYTGPFEVAAGRDDGPEAISRIMTGDNENDAYDPWYEPAEAPRTIPVVRAATVNAEGRVGDIATASYLPGEMATRYGTTPVFSLCAEWADLFDNTDGPGIYRFPTSTNKTKVANAHVEFFDGGGRQFAKWCELRGHGTTTLKRPKKSLRLTGWEGYNPVKGKKKAFDYPFFADKTRTGHASIVLRMGGNDWNKAILRDRLAQAIGADGEVDGEEGAVCVLFLNGVYWGVHEIRERYDSKWFEKRLGVGDPDAFSLLEYADGKPYPQAREGRGEDEDKQECRSQAATEFKGILDQLAEWGDDLSDGERYAWFTNRVNPDSLAAFCAAELFAGNSDWPWNNQLWWRVWPADGEGDDPVDRSRPRNDGRWNWAFHDMDFAFALPFDYVPDWYDGLRAAHDSYAGIHPGEGPYVGDWMADASRPFRAAMENREFRTRFLGRLYLRLATDWAPENTLAALERIAGEMRAAGMDENGARWRQPQTEADWEKQLDDIRDYLVARPEAFAWHTRKRYRLGAPRTVVLGTDGDGEGSLRVAGRNPGDGTLPLRGSFPCDLPLELEAVPAKGSSFAGWFAAPELLPEALPAARAEDCAANYGGTGGGFPAASLGTGWDEWNVSYSGNEGGAAVFTRTSPMPIHGRSENGKSFGLRACDGGYAAIRRELADGSVLGVGEEMSFDVAFGISGGNGGAGVAFTTAGDASRPVELLLVNAGGEGEAFLVSLGGTFHIAENFRHIPGAPIRVALARTGQHAGRLRLERGNQVFFADVPLAGGITGIRLYKNPYGSADAKYDLWFDHLRVGPAAGGEAGEALQAEVLRSTDFYEDGNAFNAWIAGASGGYGGSWQNTEPLCNIGLPSFGLWANGGGTSTLWRSLPYALTNGTELSFGFQNKALHEEGSAAGVRFFTAGGRVSFSFYAEKGSANYRLKAGEGETATVTDTGVPVVSSGLEVSVAPEAEGGVTATVAGRPFALAADPAICALEFFNRHAGSGPACNVFFNRVWVRRDSGVAKPESGSGTDEGNVVFHENGANLANWRQASNSGSANGWAGSGSEDSRILGAQTFYLYAGGPAPGDDKPYSKLWRMFPDDLALGAGAVLSFRFAHGDIGSESDEGIGSVGWNLLNGYEDSMATFSATRDGETYLWNGLPLAVAKTQDTAHKAEIRFASATKFDFWLDGELQAADMTVVSPVRGIRFWNAKAGSTSARNLLVNDITVTLPAAENGGTLAAGRNHRATRNGGEILLSADRIWTLVPSNDIAVVARFVPAPVAGIDAWAAEQGIGDPWTTNAASGRPFAEEYLLETNGVTSLHGIEKGVYRLHFAPGENGVGAQIEVTDTLGDEDSWHAAAPDELPPLDESGRLFSIGTSGERPKLFIRLVLRPDAP